MRLIIACIYRDIDYAGWRMQQLPIQILYACDAGLIVLGLGQVIDKLTVVKFQSKIC